jgi:hypothetical protein
LRICTPGRCGCDNQKIQNRRCASLCSFSKHCVLQEFLDGPYGSTPARGLAACVLSSGTRVRATDPLFDGVSLTAARDASSKCNGSLGRNFEKQNEL